MGTPREQEPSDCTIFRHDIWGFGSPATLFQKWEETFLSLLMSSCKGHQTCGHWAGVAGGRKLRHWFVLFRGWYISWARHLWRWTGDMDVIPYHLLNDLSLAPDQSELLFLSSVSRVSVILSCTNRPERHVSCLYYRRILSNFTGCYPDSFSEWWKE